jgi:hypothetical protein
MRTLSYALLLLASLLSVSFPIAAYESKLPIKSGTYTFSHKFAEHPNMGSVPLTVKIRGKRVTVINETESSVFPKGVLAKGKLRWHAGSKKWIIATSKEDLTAPEVGGCSDGPDEIDLVQRIYWTC